MQRLYEIRTEIPKFNRPHAVKYFHLWNTGRKEFGLFYSRMKAAKYDYSAIQTMVGNYKYAKEEFHKTSDVVKPFKLLIRKIWGKEIRVPLSGEGKTKFTTALCDMRIHVRRLRDEAKRNKRDTIFTFRNDCNAGYWLRRYQAKVFQSTKRPQTDADFTGIEIECVMPSNADLTQLMPFAKWINVGTDGSIDHDDDETGQEIRVCVERENVREVLPGLVNVLKSLGAYVNESCGLHVHVDQRNEKQPDLTFAKLVRSLPLLYRIVPASRRNNTYCKRNRRVNFQMAMNGRCYKAINATAYSRYKTLEVRLFGGTLDSTNIINWIEVLWAIVKGDMLLRCPRTFDLACKHWNLSPENLAWLKEREAEFAALNTAPINESDDEERPDEDEALCAECSETRANCGCDEFQEAA